jgi:hypothetical protein
MVPKQSWNNSFKFFNHVSISPEEMASACLPFLLRYKYRLVFICFHFEYQLYVIAYVRQTKFHAEV